MDNTDLIKEALQGVVVDTPEVTKKAGYKFVNRVAYGEDDTTTDTIEVPDFGGEPTGHVSVSAHLTKNLGNFESARIGVEIMLPVLASESEVVRVYDRISNLVSQILDEQVASLAK